MSPITRYPDAPISRSVPTRSAGAASYPYICRADTFFRSPGTFANQIGTIRDGDTNGVFYPGGGIEFNAGAFGIRLEAGDEMYWDNGVNHNFKFMGGPQIRF